MARWLDVSEHWLRFGPDPTESNRLTGGADRPLSIKDLARRLQALSSDQRQIVEALLLEFEKVPPDVPHRQTENCTTLRPIRYALRCPPRG